MEQAKKFVEMAVHFIDAIATTIKLSRDVRYLCIDAWQWYLFKYA